MPQPIDYGARYRAIYDKHIVVGYLQEGEFEYAKLISSAMDPEKTADAIDVAHAEWMAFLFEHSSEYRPGIGKWLKEGYWTRRPKARDSPPVRKSNTERMLDEAEEILRREEQEQLNG